jgi:N-acyl-D-amino-acid deacylase
VDELIKMAVVAAQCGGYYGTHVGSEGFDIGTELDKTFQIARASGIPVHIYHLKIRGREHWGQIGGVIDAIESALAEGLEVTADQYPYTAMQHPWHRLMPRWIQDAPRSETIPQFRDRQFRDRVKADPEFDQYVKEHGGWEGVVMSIVADESLKPDEGKTVADIARQRNNADPVETCFDLVAENGAFPGGVYHTMSEEDVRTVMRLPWISIASDGSALNDQVAGLPHPRSFGSNSRVLGTYVREQGVLPLEEAIRKMTSLPAQVLRSQDRGLLREGCWADIVAFDPATVGERGTFENPKQYCQGVEHVLVNGVPVITHAQHTGARPGMVVYGLGYRGG